MPQERMSSTGYAVPVRQGDILDLIDDSGMHE